MDSARHGTPSVETFVVSGLANKRINSAPLVECGVMSSCAHSCQRATLKGNGLSQELSHFHWSLWQTNCSNRHIKCHKKYCWSKTTPTYPIFYLSICIAWGMKHYGLELLRRE